MDKINIAIKDLIPYFQPERFPYFYDQVQKEIIEPMQNYANYLKSNTSKLDSVKKKIKDRVRDFKTTILNKINPKNSEYNQFRSSFEKITSLPKEEAAFLEAYVVGEKKLNCYKKALTMIKEVNPYKQIAVPKDLSYETVEKNFIDIYLQLEKIHNVEHEIKEVTVKEVLEQLDQCKKSIEQELDLVYQKHKELGLFQKLQGAFEEASSQLKNEHGDNFNRSDVIALSRKIFEKGGNEQIYQNIRKEFALYEELSCNNELKAILERNKLTDKIIIKGEITRENTSRHLIELEERYGSVFKQNRNNSKGWEL
ncbi:MAG TPA: hypothetical protein PLZ08_04605 [Bacillota bacterium]|jgi:hypothetical protein|nr:hypothetical protein [Bacillota bacterium]HOL10221.1 hypothetical protein [Bacillota bacterium]HPO97223.1 hypothetical protein [Bacillota bacterium]